MVDIKVNQTYIELWLKHSPLAGNLITHHLQQICSTSCNTHGNRDLQDDKGIEEMQTSRKAVTLNENSQGYCHNFNIYKSASAVHLNLITSQRLLNSFLIEVP